MSARLAVSSTSEVRLQGQQAHRSQPLMAPKPRGRGRRTCLTEDGCFWSSAKLLHDQRAKLGAPDAWPAWGRLQDRLFSAISSCGGGFEDTCKLSAEEAHEHVQDHVKRAELRSGCFPSLHAITPTALSGHGDS